VGHPGNDPHLDSSSLWDGSTFLLRIKGNKYVVEGGLNRVAVFETSEKNEDFATYVE
jgi:hypothetical protein